MHGTGSCRIVPVIAHRTEAHLAAAAAKRGERWQRIALQASEQSRRTSPPEISPPVKLKEACDAADRHPDCPGGIENKLTLKDALLRATPPKDVTLAFGPEGGWTESELKIVSRGRLDRGIFGKHDSARRDRSNRRHGVALPELQVRFLLRKILTLSLICSCKMASLKPSTSRETPLRAFEADERQREAIDHVHGPMLVIAGAGTGKTTVLTKRIARLVRRATPVPTKSSPLPTPRMPRMRCASGSGKNCAGPTSRNASIRLSTNIATIFSRENGKEFEVLDDQDLWIYLRQRLRELKLNYFVRAARVSQFLEDLLEFMRHCHDELVTPEKYQEYVQQLDRGELPVPE